MSCNELECSHCQEELRRALSSLDDPSTLTATSSSPSHDLCPPGSPPSSLWPTNNNTTPSALASHGESPLIVAVRRGFTLVVGELLRTGCDITRVNEDGRTALHWAAKTGNLSSVRLLLEFGAHVDAMDLYGFTPLMLSCRQGHHHVVQDLVHAGCDVNASNALGETALFYASKDQTFRSTDKCAEILIQNGADVQRRNANGCTALHIAVMFKKNNVVKMLLAQNCPTNCYGSLSFVSNYQSVDMVVTPLEVAFLTGNYDICGLLVDSGSDPNVLLPYLQSESELKGDGVPDWLREAVNTPLSLRAACRSNIRRLCGSHIHEVINSLPLPVQIKDYLFVPELKMESS